MKKRRSVELKRFVSVKKIVLATYFCLFFIYLFIGFLPADATNYVISTKMNIPSINLSSDVTALKVENRSLNTPDSIVGSYSKNNNKTLLIGHSSTVFQNLNKTYIGDTIWYNDHAYIVSEKNVYLKKDIRMDDILKAEAKDTIVVMTCAGESLGNGDATHRLILTAKAV